MRGDAAGIDLMLKLDKDLMLKYDCVLVLSNVYFIFLRDKSTNRASQQTLIIKKMKLFFWTHARVADEAGRPNKCRAKSMHINVGVELKSRLH